MMLPQMTYEFDCVQGNGNYVPSEVPTNIGLILLLELTRHMS